jgi:hypothetical protein
MVRWHSFVSKAMQNDKIRPWVNAAAQSMG